MLATTSTKRRNSLFIYIYTGKGKVPFNSLNNSALAAPKEEEEEEEEVHLYTKENFERIPTSPKHSFFFE